MNVQLAKIFRDLWIYRLRTFLSAMAIFIGLIVFGGIATANNLLSQTYQQAFEAANPAQVIINIPAFEKNILDSVRDAKHVQIADARYVTNNMRLTIAANDWMSLSLHAIDDFSTIRMQKLIKQGLIDSNPQTGTIWLDRSILQRVPYRIGDNVTLQAPDGENYTLQISGFVNDVVAFPTHLSDQAVGYITMETLQDIEQAVYMRPTRPAFNQIYVQFDIPATDLIEIQNAVESLKRLIKGQNYNVASIEFQESKPPLVSQTDALAGLLILSTILSFSVTGVLISSFVSAIIGRQIREIGIMKSLGALPGQITILFLIMMLIIGLIALVPALLLTAPIARALTNFLVSQIDIDVEQIVVPLSIRVVQVLAAILLPVIAALIPIIQGSFVTVQQSLNSDGNVSGAIGRLIRFSPAGFMPLLTMQMATRNVFLKPGRFLLTTLSLMFPGALFIASFGVQTTLQSLDTSVTNMIFNYDLEFSFNGTAPIDRIEKLTLDQPGVLYVETWRQGTAHRIYTALTEYANQSPKEQVSGDILIRGIPLSSRIIQFTPDQLISGNGIRQPDDILLTYEAYDDFSLPIDQAQSIIMDADFGEEPWDIVGVTGPLAIGEGFMSIDTFEKFIPNSASSIRMAVIADVNTPDESLSLIESLREVYQDEGIAVNNSMSVTSFVEQRAGRIGLVTQTLILLSIMIGVVSVIGLVSTISINVRERTKSIGILRSLGSDYRHLGLMVFMESLTIAMISYVLALGLSFIVGWQISSTLAQQLYMLDATYRIEAFGAIVWLLLMIGIGIGAAIGPALYAINVTITDTLRYEG